MEQTANITAVSVHTKSREKSGLAKLLLSTYTGISTEMAEELCHRAALTNDRSASSMTDADRASLWNAFRDLMETVQRGDFAPCIYYKKEEGGRRG